MDVVLTCVCVCVCVLGVPGDDGEMRVQPPCGRSEEKTDGCIMPKTEAKARKAQNTQKKYYDGK